jgi:hypothetical protein
MPIRLTIFHPDRMIMGVAIDQVTLVDLVGFFREIVDSKALHYRKLIDVTSAVPALSKEELAAFGERVRVARGERPRGALAIVADSNRGEFARFFTELRTGTDAPPTKVFRSIHDARRWIAAQPLDL